MLTLVEAPATLPISLVEAKAAARIAVDDDDALVAGLIRAAVAQIDGRDGWLGRQLINATWDYTLDCFPWAIRVPLPPTQEILSIVYVDPAGAEQTLDPSTYQVAGTDPARIMPAPGQAWPATRHQMAAVTVRFVAGYGSWSDVPEDLRAAISLMVASAYDGCSSDAAKAILMRYRAAW